MTHYHHIDDLLDAYFDDSLSTRDQASFANHIATCDRCLSMVNDFRQLIDETSSLPRSIDPSRDLWSGIENRLHDSAETTNDKSTRPVPSRMPVWPTTLLAAAAVVAVAALLVTLFPSQDEWEVIRVAGVPTLDTTDLTGTATIAAGQHLVTDGESQAAIQVGNIGALDILPGTRIQLLSTRRSDHRFRLSSGTIHATINAPPRIFFVETPSALAIDLGCEYTLSVDSTGQSHLHVTFGYVELNHRLRNSVIPEGYRAISRESTGPTVAYDEDASEEFVSALVRLEFESDVSAVDDILNNATPLDAPTLWLLLERNYPDSNRKIYGRLVDLVGEPEGSTMEGVLGGNVEMSLAWQNHLGLDLTLMTFDGVKQKKKKRNP